MAEEFVNVAEASGLAEGGHVCATVNGKRLALFKVGGRFYAIDSRCTHIGGPLCEGKVEGDVVTCPLHHSQFNVKTGAVVKGPAGKPVKTYPIRVNGKNVEVQA